MFEQLFARPAAVARHRSARFAAERERFLRHLSSQHYALTSLRCAAHDLLAIVLQTDLADRRQVTGEEIREATRHRRSLHLGCRQGSSDYIRQSLRRTGTAWMAFLGRLATDPQPATRDGLVLKQFETFLRDERGLASSTIKRCCWHARRLLDHLAGAGLGAVNVLASPILDDARAVIIDRLNRLHLPAIYQWPELAELGGLAGYGPRLAGVIREAMEIVNKILRGAHPADIPVQQPTRFELAINLKTAWALGLTIPPGMLDLADKVIE